MHIDEKNFTEGTEKPKGVISVANHVKDKFIEDPKKYSEKPCVCC